MDVRVLSPGDQGELAAFLDRHAASSMFLRSNLRLAGIVNKGERLQGDYYGAFDGKRLIAVAAHYWNGNVILQAPTAVSELMEAVEGSRREILGMLGPAEQVERARASLGLSQEPRLDETEGLFSLDLAALKVPADLAAGRVLGRLSEQSDLETAIQWRSAYALETLGATDGQEHRRECRENMERLHGERSLFLLAQSGAPVAMSAFNARLPDCVQIGGVYTPPELRRRGYARCIVAASLISAREQGVKSSILFTASEYARRAYEAIGFRRIGDYAILLFKGAHS